MGLTSASGGIECDHSELQRIRQHVTPRSFARLHSMACATTRAGAGMAAPGAQKKRGSHSSLCPLVAPHGVLESLARRECGVLVVAQPQWRVSQGGERLESHFAEARIDRTACVCRHPRAFFSGMSRTAPVLGLRPLRAARVRDSNVPKLRAPAETQRVRRRGRPFPASGSPPPRPRESP